MSLPMHPMPREGTETDVISHNSDYAAMHPMPREGTETMSSRISARFVPMHPMPREGTETISAVLFYFEDVNASYAPWGDGNERKHIFIENIKMHPMPREGTETYPICHAWRKLWMHPMPREGKETKFLLFHDFRPLIQSIPPRQGTNIF